MYVTIRKVDKPEKIELPIEEQKARRADNHRAYMRTRFGREVKRRNRVTYKKRLAAAYGCNHKRAYELRKLESPRRPLS